MGCQMDDLREVGAYLQGHFLLTTGRHSDQFFLLARLTEYPERLRPWVETLALQLKPYGARTVVGPAVGGIIPAFAVSALLPESRMLFAEKDETGGMRFKRGFRLEAGEPVVVVEDAVTTGSSVDKVVQAVRQAGGMVRAVGALVDRTENPIAHWDFPFHAVTRVAKVSSWEPADCPLCQAGIALERPKG